MDEGIDDPLYTAIALAYQRGVAWALENHDMQHYAVKASLDYADNAKSELDDKLAEGIECPLCGINP